MTSMDDLPQRDDGLVRPSPAEEAETARLVSARLLRHVVVGVYAPAQLPDSVTLRARAVLLGLSGTTSAQRAVAPAGDPSGAVVGHLTAAWIHAGGEPPPRVDVVIAPGSTRLRSTVLRLHEHRLAPRDVERVAELLVTTPVRTAADVARMMAPATALRQLDTLAQVCGVSAVDVLAQLERTPHGRGVARARALVHTWASARASRQV